MESVLRISRILTRAMAIAGGLLLILLAGVICFEVVARKLFSFSTRATEEYSGYVLAICLSWSIAFTLLERAHVRIDVLYRKVPRSAGTGMDVFSLLAIAAAVALMTVNAFTVLSFNFEFQARSNTTLQTLLWIPQGLWFLGFVIFDLIALVLLLAVVRHLVAADVGAIRSLIGPRGLEEEIEDDLEASVTTRNHRTAAGLASDDMVVVADGKTGQSP